MSHLSPADLAALKADIDASPDLNCYPNTSDGNYAIATLYNQPADPPRWVWRTSVSEQDYYTATSVDATTWDWSAYLARTAAERDGWGRLFDAGRSVDPSLATVREAFAVLLSDAQQAHVLACSRRPATRAEAVIGQGSGTASEPLTVDIRGPITYDEIAQARGVS